MSQENRRQFHQYGVNNRYNPFHGSRGRLRQAPGALHRPRPFFRPNLRNPFYQYQHYPQLRQFFPPTPFTPVHPHPVVPFDPNLFPSPQFFPVPQIDESICTNSAFPNMPYLHSSTPFDAQYLPANNNEQHHQATQYLKMSGADTNRFVGVNNNFYSFGNPQVSYTVNNMHMNTTDSTERSQSFTMQYGSSYPRYTDHATNPFHRNVNWNNTVITPTHNFYQNTQTLTPSSTIVRAGNKASTNTNSLTRNISMPTSVNTANSNQWTASYSESLGLRESNGTQFHDSGATNGLNNNLINGNNYESNLGQSYNNWVYSNNIESNNMNYETNLMGQSNGFREFLSNVNNIKTESDSVNQSNRTSTSNSTRISSSAESAPPSNPDRMTFVNENLIQIGAVFYSRTVKLKGTIYVNPNFLPNQRDNSIEAQGNNININPEPESQLLTNIVKRETKSDTSDDDSATIYQNEAESRAYSKSKRSGEANADENIENFQINNIKLKDNVCRMKSQCGTHLQLAQRHKPCSVLNKSI